MSNHRSSRDILADLLLWFSVTMFVGYVVVSVAALLS